MLSCSQLEAALAQLCLPSEAACLDDLFWGQRRPKIRDICEDKPAQHDVLAL